MDLLKKKLENLFIESGLITAGEIEKALDVQRNKGGSLSHILVQRGCISQKDLMLFLSKHLNIPTINLSKYKLKPEVLQIIPERLARRCKIIPISMLGKEITVAVSDPLNIFTIDDIKNVTGYKVRTVIATPEDIDRTIEKYYTKDTADELSDEDMEDLIDEDMEVVRDGAGELDINEIMKGSDEAPVVKMVNLILVEALRRRASDIHFEPAEKRVRVRYRIDGNLKEVYSLPKKIQNSLAARFKIMSRLDITEHRVPQDGRFNIKVGKQEIDLRVSVLPVSHGEKIVLRLLDKANLQVGLDKLGYLPGPLTAFQESIKKPYGMILVTGPTGSGKSTTLYSILNLLNTPAKNIITVEDPVEYQVAGITQVPVRTEIGMTFSGALRSILRQSPDIVMVGEIRDGETGDIAIKASLTGHLVLSTLHTNDAPSSITRLIDMGVEPFLVSSSLIMVAAQRLCRRLCTSCRKPYEPDKDALIRAGLDSEALSNPTFYEPAGCNACGKSGYKGRMGTLEVLVLDQQVREMIVARKSLEEIKKYAVQTLGMKTLRQNALIKFSMGLTSLEEVLRIT